MKNWLSKFESLGENCEFGFVQRALGINTSSLFRWAFVDSEDAICEAISSNFSGGFVFENLEPAGAGTMVRDRKLQIAFHSKQASVQHGEFWEFVHSNSERALLFKEERKKFLYLAGKFIFNLEKNDQIYVLKRNQGIKDDAALRVHKTISSRGNGRVLYVVEATSSNQPGTVEKVVPGLVKGFIDRFAPIDQSDNPSLSCWESILQSASKVFQEESTTIHNSSAPLMFSQSTNSVEQLYDLKHQTKAKPAWFGHLVEEDQALYELLSPSSHDGDNPFFDKEVYAKNLFSLTGEKLPSSENALQHWFKIGKKKRIVPTRFFDENYYIETNSDLRNANCFGFVHFVLHGNNEGRKPTEWFDGEYYSKNYAGARDYHHFLTTGASLGYFPSYGTERLYFLLKANEKFSLEVFALLITIGTDPNFRLNSSKLEALSLIFMPQWHNANGKIINSFFHYIFNDFNSNNSPGPLFDTEIYRRKALEANLPLTGLSANAVLHWLCYGFEARIVPTERFDEAFYLRQNQDIAASPDWAFIHYVQHGLYEGRPGLPGRGFNQAEYPNATFTYQHQRWFEEDFAKAYDHNLEVVPEHLNDRLEKALKSEQIKEIFLKAQALDPAVGQIEDINLFMLPPYYDEYSSLHSIMKSRLPRLQYDSVVCVPWIRLGGADLVAGLLAKSLLRLRPEEKLLILRTDSPLFERSDWIPDRADVVDISDLIAQLGYERGVHLFKVLLSGIAAKRVFNVNSKLCWIAMRDHGSYMAKCFKNYAYLFCWDRLPSGLRAGYPAEFFAGTIDHLAACFTDTEYLKRELGDLYLLPPTTLKKITPLLTPAQSVLRLPAVAREVAWQKDPSTRRRVFWGGRLDRQKRFPLVIELARRMPDVEFFCWGASVLDEPLDLSDAPSNLLMQGTFKSFDDLPLSNAGIWLFTALWEGMPTTLIELATRGMGIVASAVGGVPELITDETGWPIAEDASVDDYEEALRDALKNPQKTAERAEALQRHVEYRYNDSVYDSVLSEQLKLESEQ
ncbi:glycosyltransferase family 4 protein [Acidocella aminolytica]|jgi:glycosyltransferase involved in cell wall biosynthesis|uniref:Glycosyl transferase n=1 Tax=Acidocella aminolytica 101 = DSM 11237 TaxID=1120923 RepID=A0A0D6PD76_9PROT|nr:glycosyltransferase family 4 protein [Acidocella aminolytica]GAN79607.1 glycosyl transferase [Acidocella aminolytica 101 = DSM 11237]GBQ37890.1 hypothetical protein AA11237_1667 [Acidocella aminolytica 101 = DSM 11237]SHF55175.1 Glycosyl transferases group 1 [Acidocella aminolytica 101 = DSM 11237]